MARLHENNIFLSNGLKNSVNRPLMKDFYVNCQLSRENEVRKHIPVPYDNLFKGPFSSEILCSRLFLFWNRAIVKWRTLIGPLL